MGHAGGPHHEEHGHEHPPTGCQSCRDHSHLGRRRFLEVLGVGVAAVLAGCAPGRSSATQLAAAPVGDQQPASGTSTPATAAPRPTTTSSTLPPVVELDNIPEPRPGVAHKVSQGPKGTRDLAITIDDGFCQPCVDGYVELARRTGIHITFSPNGTYQGLWNPHAEVLRPLIEAGQVQIGNHTYHHPDLRKLDDSEIEAELERNERWINRTFGITSRPWYRPPFGFRNERVDAAAAALGYTNTLLWNGTLGDSNLLTPEVLMGQAEAYLRPGVILLGHANHPTVIEVFGQIEDLIRERNLTPVTLDEMFGTSRNEG